MKHKLFTLLALAGTIACGAFAFAACGETDDNNGNVGNNPSVDVGNNGGNNGNNGDVGGKDDNTENPPETHEHTLERHAAESATCTEGGNIEYWSCTGCKKNYSYRDDRRSRCVNLYRKGENGRQTLLGMQ